MSPLRRLYVYFHAPQVSEYFHLWFLSRANIRQPHSAIALSLSCPFDGNNINYLCVAASQFSVLAFRLPHNYCSQTCKKEVREAKMFDIPDSFFRVCVIRDRVFSGEKKSFPNDSRKRDTSKIFTKIPSSISSIATPAQTTLHSKVIRLQKDSAAVLIREEFDSYAKPIIFCTTTDSIGICCHNGCSFGRHISSRCDCV